MEIVSFGETCLRLRGKEGIVVTDAFPRIVGPTGRGLTADIVTYSHPDGQSSLGLETMSQAAAAVKANRKAKRADQVVPTSLEPAFLLDSPGEFEVHHVLISGVRTYRDEESGAQRGNNLCFVFELDGVHVVHLGDVGHLLTEAQVGEIGTVDVACVTVGGALTASKAAELVAQLDAKMIVPMPLDGAEKPDGELSKFLHEMSATAGEPAPKLSVTPSSLPAETTVVLLESRQRS
jgi:L-ascorbate metabolism protein UlaG (beta-lactamase superfamily)